MNLREAQDLLIRLGQDIPAVTNTRAERSGVRFHGNVGSVAVEVEVVADEATKFQLVGHDIRATGTVDEAGLTLAISRYLDKVEFAKVQIAQERVVDVQAKYDARRP